jgi:hypothetical protein
MRLVGGRVSSMHVSRAVLRRDTIVHRTLVHEARFADREHEPDGQE